MSRKSRKLLRDITWARHFLSATISVFKVSLGIQSECGKIRTRKTPNMDTFHAVIITNICEKIPIPFRFVSFVACIGSSGWFNVLKSTIVISNVVLLLFLLLVSGDIISELFGFCFQDAFFFKSVSQLFTIDDSWWFPLNQFILRYSPLSLSTHTIQLSVKVKLL